MDKHDSQKIINDLFEQALEENKNPYLTISKMMWWELFFKLNQDASFIDIFEEEYFLTEMFISEIEYKSNNKIQFSIEQKMQRFKIDFLKMLLNYFKSKLEPTIEQLKIQINENSILDNEIIINFNKFKKDLIKNPLKWKNKIKQYQKDYLKLSENFTNQTKNLDETNNI